MLVASDRILLKLLLPAAAAATSTSTRSRCRTQLQVGKQAPGPCSRGARHGGFRAQRHSHIGTARGDEETDQALACKLLRGGKGLMLRRHWH